MRIQRDAAPCEAVSRLLIQHLEQMHQISPPGSVHALDPEALRSPDLTFWSAWQDDELLGCGALKRLGKDRGEVKAMRTVDAHRRRGIAARILERILDEAVRRDYRTLYLETGAQPEFAPARALYTRYGFVPCGPFEGYTDDPNSAFMAKRL